MTNVTTLRTQVTRPQRAPRMTPRRARKLQQQVCAGAAVGLVALTLTGLSLTHLAHGISIVTTAPAWESWAMAVGVDLGFVALEFAQLTVGERLRRTIGRWARPTIVGTLAGSAILNAFAFGAAASGLLIGPAIALGVAIPALIYSLTRVGASILLDQRAKGG